MSRRWFLVISGIVAVLGLLIALLGFQTLGITDTGPGMPLFGLSLILAGLFPAAAIILHFFITEKAWAGTYYSWCAVVCACIAIGALILFLYFHSMATPPLHTECVLDSECETPMDYLVRSSCPFGSACIEGSCRVVCPHWAHSPNISEDSSYPAICVTDADCACDHYQSPEIEDCICHEGRCLAVVSS